MLHNNEQKCITSLGHNPRPAISMGTTLVAIEYGDGVVVATDSRTSRGSFVASRATDKITPITDHLVVCRSGNAADTQAIADYVSYFVELYTMTEREAVDVYRSAQIMRNFVYDYRDNLITSLIVGGYDGKEKGQVYVIQLGGFVTRQRYAANGSGSTYILGYLDRNWKANMTLSEAKKLLKTAVLLAINRDNASGGVVRLAVVDRNGTHRELFRPDKDNNAIECNAVECATPYAIWPKHTVYASEECVETIRADGERVPA